ncbi:MAG TPA: alpha/beta fold hydrolase [Ktedonosporobacter sp.]|nr:alpha/beta fold hydrolase [Ktedonosporobacter sp.]
MNLFTNGSKPAGFALSPGGNQLALFTYQQSQSLLTVFDIQSDAPCIASQIPLAMEVSGAAMPSFSPDGSYLAFTGERPGDSFDLYLFHMLSGFVEQLTPPGRKNFVYLPNWSPDSRLITCSYFERPVSPQNQPGIITIDIRTKQLIRRTRALDSTLPKFSPDGKRLAFCRWHNLWLVDLETETELQLTQLAQDDEPVDLHLYCWSPDGRYLVFEYGPNNQRVVGLFDTCTSTYQRLSEEGKDARGPSWSPTQETISYVEAKRKLVFITPEGKRLCDQDLPDGEGIATYHDNSPRWAQRGNCLVLRDRRASNVWLVLPERPPRQVTFFLPPSAPHKPRNIIYPGQHGKQVPGFLFIPHDTVVKGAIIWVHGGPHASEDPRNPSIQALVSAGFVVLSPDYQGSTGYGPAWEKLKPSALGEVDLLDIVDGHTFLSKDHMADRVGIVGYSYGGYPSVLALAKYPDLWIAGGSLWGIFDARVIQFHATHAEPAYDTQWLDRRSPNALIEKIVAPLLILHGAHDSQSTVEEVQTAAARLKQQGQMCDLHIFWDDGHGLPYHQQEGCQLVASFFLQSLEG